MPVEVEIEGAHSERGVVARMTASNLSLGGVYCVSSHDFPEMTRLAVRMSLPCSGKAPIPLDLEAVVVRRESVESPASGSPRYHLALFFTRIEENHKSLLADYLHGNA
jgi:hypothetical protein